MRSATRFRRLPLILPLLGFVLATLLLTYPLAFRLSDFINDVPAVDHGANYWNLWWAERWVSSSETQLLYTDYLFHPEGVPLVFHTLTVLNGLLSIPIQRLFGLTVAYNLIVLLSFVLTGLATYLLARHWGAERLSGFVVGLWFAFSVYRFHHWDHLNLLSTHWLVFFLWALSRFLHSARLKDALLTGVFWAATGLCSWYYLVFAGTSGVLLCVCVALRQGRALQIRRWLLGCLIVTGVFLLIMSPYVSAILKARQDAPPDDLSFAVSAYFSVDVLCLLLPHTLLSPFVNRAGLFAFTAECPEAIFPTTTVLLALLGLILMPKRLPRALPWEWIGMGSVFALLSLGPFLKVGGLVQMGEMGYVLMPGYLFKKMPMMGFFKVFDRFLLVTHLGLMVFVAPFLGFLIARLAEWLRLRPTSIWAVVIVLSVAQGWHGGISMTDKKPSDFFTQVASETGDFSIVEVPFDTEAYPSHGRAMFHQTIHHKRTINGEVSRPPKSLHTRLERNLVISLLKKYYEVEQYPVSEEDRIRFLEDAHSLRLRYVVLYPERLRIGYDQTLEEFLVGTLNGTMVYTEPGMRVFRIE
ncbi:MAG TPA: hypothetical protein PKH07_00265 [bacterium]|nr:hypothetical protein [bacterium]